MRHLYAVKELLLIYHKIVIMYTDMNIAISILLSPTILSYCLLLLLLISFFYDPPFQSCSMQCQIAQGFGKPLYLYKGIITDSFTEQIPFLSLN